MIRHWLEAFRLRTIPLSISGICMGSFIAFHSGHTDYLIFIIALTTTVLFQIISNLANDLGDFVKGTDNDKRTGPARTIQSGKITVYQMKIAITVTSILSLLSAFLLIYLARENMSSKIIFSYLILACFCVIAAITYTVGKKPYGYSGFGDLMVFIFFGVVGVIGSNTLFTKEIDWSLLLPASVIGCLSSAVLNLNNMRDIANDTDLHKNTIVVKIGQKKAKLYHCFLLVFAFLCLISYSILKQNYWLSMGCLPILSLFKHCKIVIKNKNPQELDSELKKVALTTFLVSLFVGLGLLFQSKF